MVSKILFSISLTTIVFAQSNFELKYSKWYTSKQVLEGKELFLKNCAVCHGQKAEKTVIWKKTLPDGSYPPPPLNGNAHAWHHPKSQLKSIISKGGAQYGGKMPGFETILSDKEQDAVISYFQDFWSYEIYKRWIDADGLTK